MRSVWIQRPTSSRSASLRSSAHGISAAGVRRPARARSPTPREAPGRGRRSPARSRARGRPRAPASRTSRRRARTAQLARPVQQLLAPRLADVVEGVLQLGVEVEVDDRRLAGVHRSQQAVLRERVRRPASAGRHRRGWLAACASSRPAHTGSASAWRKDSQPWLTRVASTACATCADHRTYGAGQLLQVLQRQLAGSPAVLGVPAHHPGVDGVAVGLHQLPHALGVPVETLGHGAIVTPRGARGNPCRDRDAPGEAAVTAAGLRRRPSSWPRPWPPPWSGPRSRRCGPAPG